MSTWPGANGVEPAAPVRPQRGLPQRRRLTPRCPRPPVAPRSRCSGCGRLRRPPLPAPRARGAAHPRPPDPSAPSRGLPGIVQGVRAPRDASGSPIILSDAENNARNGLLSAFRSPPEGRARPDPPLSRRPRRGGQKRATKGRSPSLPAPRPRRTSTGREAARAQRRGHGAPDAAAAGRHLFPGSPRGGGRAGGGLEHVRGRRERSRQEGDIGFAYVERRGGAALASLQAPCAEGRVR